MPRPVFFALLVLVTLGILAASRYLYEVNFAEGRMWIMQNKDLIQLEMTEEEVEKLLRTAPVPGMTEDWKDDAGNLWKRHHYRETQSGVFIQRSKSYSVDFKNGKATPYDQLKKIAVPLPRK